MVYTRSTNGAHMHIRDLRMVCKAKQLQIYSNITESYNSDSFSIMDCSDSRSEQGQGYDTDNDVKQLLPKRSLTKAQAAAARCIQNPYSKSNWQKKWPFIKARKENPHCFELTLCIQNAELWSPGREGCPKAHTLFTTPKEF